MPILKQYVNHDGYYIHGAFLPRERGSKRLQRHKEQLNVTFQITLKGVARLFAKGVKVGGKIPYELFFLLKSSKDIYTESKAAQPAAASLKPSESTAKPTHKPKATKRQSRRFPDDMVEHTGDLSTLDVVCPKCHQYVRQTKIAFHMQGCTGDAGAAIRSTYRTGASRAR